MPVSKKVSRNNLKLNLKLRAISRRMDSLLHKTKGGKLCLHLCDVCVIAYEVSDLYILEQDEERYRALNEFIGVFDTKVLEVVRDHYATIPAFDNGRMYTECFSPYTFKPDADRKGPVRTLEGSIVELADFPKRACQAKSVEEANDWERRLIIGLVHISVAFNFRAEDEDFLKAALVHAAKRVIKDKLLRKALEAEINNDKPKRGSKLAKQA